MNLTGSVLTGNQAGAGGALFVRDGATAEIIASVLHDNHAVSVAAGWGGAIEVWASSSISVVGSDLTSNGAQRGGAVMTDFSDASIAISDSYLASNSATNCGGAIDTNSAATAIASTYFYSNSAAFDGGAVSIGAQGDVAIEESAFGSNSTGATGGAVTLPDGGNLKLTNSSLFLNGPYGVYNHKGTFTLVNDTLVFGGLYSAAYFNATTAVTNTMFQKGLTSVANCTSNQPLSLSSFNLSDDGSCGFGAGRDNVDLGLGGFLYNGGTVPSFLPLPGSPAIDGGTPVGAPSTDERGVSRPQGAAVDVGATEVCAVKPDKPVIVKPIDARKGKGPMVRLSWTRPTCVTNYNVTVRLGSSLGAKAFTQTAYDATSLETTPLTVGQTYWWQVAACDALGCARSKGATFTVK